MSIPLSNRIIILLLTSSLLISCHLNAKSVEPAISDSLILLNVTKKEGVISESLSVAVDLQARNEHDIASVVFENVENGSSWPLTPITYRKLNTLVTFNSSISATSALFPRGLYQIEVVYTDGTKLSEDFMLDQTYDADALPFITPEAEVIPLGAYLFYYKDNVLTSNEKLKNIDQVKTALLKNESVVVYYFNQELNLGLFNEIKVYIF